MIVLAVFTDGRDDCLAETLASAEVNLTGPVTNRIIFDDTGDRDHGQMLRRLYGSREYAAVNRGRRYAVVNRAGRLGFSGNIRDAWQQLSQLPGWFVFHLEDDFTFNRPVNLLHMTNVINENPHLVQLALRRQPWNAEERAAGGIVEQHPDDFTDCGPGGRYQWLEHRRFFSTNPSLYRCSLCDLGWPDVEHSEGVFTHQLLEDPDVRFGFWGARDSGEAVTHIGAERVGVGY